ncbi:MAG: protoheme IX farnesyltransferase [Actinobacteria bacterium]|nr:protoheme IX farnesyltransferase [Actinomycetota bacterium]
MSTLESGSSPNSADSPDGDSARANSADRVVDLAGQSAPKRTSTFSAYLGLTKPRIIELLLATTIPTMFLAAGGFPGLWLTIATLIGGTLAAGGANTLNSYIDRDIDALMKRTGHRPLVRGDVSPRAALIFGLTLSAASVVWLALTVNLLSSVLASGAIVFYVVIYTLGLKRRTAQNIVWGGAAGCFPVLIGWSAVTNSLSWAALILFLIVFFWTPPHYWPLALRFTDDYAAAGVPMLPVVDTTRAVARQIVVYSWVMVGVSLLLVPIAPMGWFYTIVATVLGALFIYEAHALLARVTRGQDAAPMRLFHWSITYLSLLFLAIAIDPFIG